MAWLLQHHSIQSGIPLLAAAVIASPPIVTLELLFLIAVVSGEPLGWFAPQSLEFLRFAAAVYLIIGCALAAITALLLLGRRRASFAEALVLSATLGNAALLIAEPGRLASGVGRLFLQFGILTLILLPAVAASGWLAARWGAFRPRQAG